MTIYPQVTGAPPIQCSTQAVKTAQSNVRRVETAQLTVTATAPCPATNTTTNTVATAATAQPSSVKVRYAPVSIHLYITYYCRYITVYYQEFMFYLSVC